MPAIPILAGWKLQAYLHALDIHILPHAAKALPYKLEHAWQGKRSIHDPPQMRLCPEQGSLGAEVVGLSGHLQQTQEDRFPKSRCYVHSHMPASQPRQHALHQRCKPQT